MRAISPTVGRWYQDLATGALFEVVAIDDHADTVETQLLDGELSEYDNDSWRELLLQEVDEPEDWRNPFELSDDDGSDPDRPLRPDGWTNPLDSVEPDVINGLSDDD